MITDTLHRYLGELLKPLSRRLTTLEANQKRTLADYYMGIHKTGEAYSRGELVTHSGSMWLCLHPTSDRPGKSGNWRLISKGK